MWNAIAYAVSVGMPTVVDPRIEHHRMHGACTYPLGYWVFLPAVLVFGLTCLVNTTKCSAMMKGWLTLASLVPVTWLTLWNFLPHNPHTFVLLGPIWFGVLVALTVYVRNYRLSLDFIDDLEIDAPVKIESIKMEHDAWFRLLVGFVATYGLALMYIYLFLKDSVVTITSSEAEQGILMIGFTLAAVLNALLLLHGFIWEMLAKVKEIRGRLLNMRRAS